MKIRKAFVMSVNAGAEQEYEKRHNSIWPELEKVLKDHGVSNYSIFLQPWRRRSAGSSTWPIWWPEVGAGGRCTR